MNLQYFRIPNSSVNSIKTLLRVTSNEFERVYHHKNSCSEQRLGQKYRFLLGYIILIWIL